jgi:hypothetical protein
MLASFSRSSRAARAAVSAAAGCQSQSVAAWRGGTTQSGPHGSAARALSTSASSSGSGDAQPGPPMRGLALAVTAALAGGGLWVSQNATQALHLRSGWARCTAGLQVDTWPIRRPGSSRRGCRQQCRPTWESTRHTAKRSSRATPGTRQAGSCGNPCPCSLWRKHFSSCLWRRHHLK